MDRRRPDHRRSAAGLALLGSLALLAACAVIERPPGGPIDVQAPNLAGVWPDSGSVGLGEVTVLRLTFSEKMNRQPATQWLHLFPERRYRKTRWHGAREAEVFLAEPLPADTLIVVEIAAGLADAHKVKSRVGRRYPLATADSLFPGAISGALVLADTALAGAVIELFAVPPDSLAYFQQPLLRRTVSDRGGEFRFDWLPVPGGPWLLRAFADGDGDLRPGEREAVRLVPDTLSLTAEIPLAEAGTTTLYRPDHPGRLAVAPFGAPRWPGTVRAFSLAVGENDSGYVPLPAAAARTPMAVLSPDSGGVIAEVKPGLNRIVVFVDVDADSAFGAVSDSLLGLPRPAGADTLAWFLEPWSLVEGVTVEPGLDRDLALGSVGDSLTAWQAPVPPAADTLQALPEALPEPPPGKPEKPRK